MNVDLMFDFYSHTIYIPDGYVSSLANLQTNFLNWIHDQPEYIVSLPDKQIAYSYDEYAFIKYVNNILLVNSNEKAYFVTKLNKKSKHVLKF